MVNSILQPDLQQRTLRLYGELLCRRASWGGQLVVAAFDGAASSGLAAAASLAGGASLTVDADGATMKAHFRDGAYDFVVNTLDEALRALKNEVRRHRPIAIGLVAGAETTLTEAVARGLAAQVVLAASSAPTPLDEALLANGGICLCGRVPSADFTAWLSRHCWNSSPIDPVQFMAQIASDDPRSAWLRNLPAHQRSASNSARWAWSADTP